MSTIMPPNPHTGLVNVTPGEVQDARMATEDVLLVRADDTLTEAGQLYVADVRLRGHDGCDTCSRRAHYAVMTGAGSPPLCSCGWRGKRHDGPILADHLREMGAL